MDTYTQKQIEEVQTEDVNPEGDQTEQINTEADITFQPGNSVWIDNTQKSFYVTKNDGSKIILSKGSWIILPNRTDPVIIDNIYISYEKNNQIQNKIKDNIGPNGISYLPWRYEEQRFATPIWGFRGNQRFIVCYPTGINKYGTHIVWDNVYLCEKPDNVTPEHIATLFNDKSI